MLWEATRRERIEKTTMKRNHCLEQTHFAIELFLYMISDHKI
jgi:hypothetical protein